MSPPPTAWVPPVDRGLVGEFAANDRLATAALWDTGGVGPAGLMIDQIGRPVTGLADGRVVRFDPERGTPETVADVGGRPLGLAAHPETGGILVCNADLGLQQVTPDGRVEVVVDSHAGRRFAVTADAAVTGDGAVYFSVPSHRHPLSRLVDDVVERSATGAVYRRDPSGDVDVVMDGLVFPNGVTLTSQEDALLVAETGSYRIHRVWLTGDRQGRSEVFRDALPGFPGALSRSGNFLWCGIPRLRHRVLDLALPRPWARHALGWAIARTRRRPPRHGMVVAFDVDGRVVANLQDPAGRVATVMSAAAFGRTLYLGSMWERTLAVVTLPPFLD